MLLRNIIKSIFITCFIFCITPVQVMPMDNDYVSDDLFLNDIGNYTNYNFEDEKSESLPLDTPDNNLQQDSSSSSSSSSLPSTTTILSNTSQSSSSNTNKNQKNLLPILKQFQDLKQHRNRFTTANLSEEAEIVLTKELTATISSSTLIDLMNQYLEKEQSRLNKVTGKILKGNEFYVQKKVLKGANEYCVIGDIHGSLHALIQILQDLYENDYLNENLKLKENFFIIFTGDYTDRGLYGAEVWYLLLMLKLTEGNWNKVFLLRGNHEDDSMNKYTEPLQLAFHSELKNKYPKTYTSIINTINSIYQYLPQALFINNYDQELQENNWLMFCHGGLDQPDKIVDFLDLSNELQVKVLQSENTSRTGFLWYDISDNCFNTNKRGNHVQALNLDWLQTLQIKILCRGHQHFGHGLRQGTDPDNANSSAIPDKDKIEPIPLSGSTPHIFTFTTATEFYISTDIFYGIIKATGSSKKWVLIPHLLHRFK